jgi:hypothetical protein
MADTVRANTRFILTVRQLRVYSCGAPPLTRVRQSQGYFKTGLLRQPAIFFFQLNTCGHSPTSLMGGWVCRLQLLDVKVKVTLRLVVYRQSVRLSVKPLKTHDQRFIFKWKSKLCHDRRSVGQSVLVQSTHLGLKTRYLSDSFRLFDMERSLWREDGSVVC